MNSHRMLLRFVRQRSEVNNIGRMAMDKSETTNEEWDAFLASLTQLVADFLIALFADFIYALFGLEPV